MNIFIAQLVFVFCVILLYWPTCKLARTVTKYTNKRVRSKGRIVYRKLSPKQQVLTAIPVCHVVYMRKRLYNGHAGFTLPMAIAIPVLVTFRLLVFSFSSSAILLTITAVGMVLVLVLHHVLYASVIYDISKMTDTTLFQRVLAIAVPFLAAFILCDKVAATFKELHKEKALRGGGV